ncbi:hypothetical protein HXX76_001223 [Chlamydomonas incerta]|uniref:Endonuclease/exonuclease/phosphatase domain-containing protein n=1 Tax=Chlamydomonas incerta TaxID=51695 RepID=A0A836B107_CHLIN|nr:hypothetical protein HXX76_001223 [Chlamydomonas incerta]|eukprot:KAG2444471.1 hypothetical protein HXX76_001223 [Chlamydomonas incerta]
MGPVTPGPLARQFIQTLKPLAANGVKVVSYNILAPKYAGYNSYCPPQQLAWEYRRELVLQELSHYGADLVALQECDEAFYGAELGGWMAAAGMQGSFLPRPVGPVPGPTEGIAVMWRSEALELVQPPRSLLYSELGPEVAGLPAEAAGTLPWLKLRELGEGAVMALLRHRASGRLLVFCCTHLFWSPVFPDVKALQAALLCGEVAAYARQAAAQQGQAGKGGPAGVPVVLCGDFNSLAEKRIPDGFDPQLPEGGRLVSGVYSLLAGGALAPEHPDHPHSRVWQPGPLAPTVTPVGGEGAPRFPALALSSAGLRLGSLNALAFGREPPVTNRTAGFAGCLDYVWLSQPDLQVAAALALPYEDGGSPPLMGPAAAAAGAPAGEGAAAGEAGAGAQAGTWRDPLADVAMPAVPDERYASDHLAVGGEVVL